MMHRWPIRVYYEDTDLAGIVYYANYLRFIERARSELVRAAGIDQLAMKAAGMVFVVRRVQADYLSPARFDDQLEVRSQLQQLKAASLTLSQEVWRHDTLIFRAVVALAVVNAEGRATRLPAAIRASLAVFTADVSR
jgi:acyl-CoA thioester hydrolase